ncbi:LPXTG cell wall anchor domain-containing protein [Sunxiuqinia elliptica]
MKKLMLILALFGMLAVGALQPVAAQEQEEDLFEMEDTLSIDDMDPVFYEAEQESGSSSTTTVLIIAAIVVVGAGVYFVAKKKKK